MSQTRLDQTLAAFDAANAEDPNLETDQGENHPKEWLYGRRMTETLNAFCPDAARSPPRPAAA